MRYKKGNKDSGDRQKRKLKRSPRTVEVRGGERLIRHLGYASRTGVGDRIVATEIDADVPNSEEARLIAKIDSTIRCIDELRAEAHADDKEIGKLGEETRRLIKETQRELKAA